MVILQQRFLKREKLLEAGKSRVSPRISNGVLDMSVDKFEVSEKLKLICNQDALDDVGNKAIFRNLGIWDHWLNEKEASELIFSYEDVKENETDLKMYMIFEDRFASLWREIYSKYLVLLSEGSNYKEYKNIDVFIDVCRDLLREKSDKIFLIPELDLCFTKGFDVSMPLYFCSEIGLSIFEPYVKKHNLFLLK